MTKLLAAWLSTGIMILPWRVPSLLAICPVARDAIKPLSETIKERDLLLVEMLGEMGEQDKSVVPVLVEMARFETYRVSQAAAKVVKQLDPKAGAAEGFR